MHEHRQQLTQREPLIGYILIDNVHHPGASGESAFLALPIVRRTLHRAISSMQLDICRRLLNTKLQNAPKYEALSYTWKPQHDRRIIYFEETPGYHASQLLVTANCASALHRLRSEDISGTLWIDAIYINQADIPERNHQLGLIAQVCNQAQQVVIYVGHGGSFTAEVSDSERLRTPKVELGLFPYVY